jgi:hypothetical protein
VTYDLTMSVAQILARQNPGMTFLYVSGMGTDSSERGPSMWARVKGKTENDVTTTEDLGRAMIKIANGGAPKSVLENRDINAVLL